MSHARSELLLTHATPVLPRWWWAGLLALSTIILCACSSTKKQITPADLAARPALPSPTAASPSYLAGNVPAMAPRSYPVRPVGYNQLDGGETIVGDAPAVGPAPVETTPGEAYLFHGGGDGCASGNCMPYGNCGPGGTCAPGLPCAPGGNCGPFNGQPCGPTGPCGPCGDVGCPPGPWAPPGVDCPWPRDEYLCDGGDEAPGVIVSRDWRIHGLAQEDTIVHYDQLHGGTDVEATNRVCLYAPRFASVRHIAPFNQYQHYEQVNRVHTPTRMIVAAERQPPTTAAQRTPPGIDLGIKRQTVLAGLDKNAVVTRDLLPVEAKGGYRPHEDFAIIRWGAFDQTEKARLAERVDAAVIWSTPVAMQVIVDGREAVTVEGDRRAQAVFTLDPLPPAKIRICKVADKCDAQPGETVEFSLRFDNIGASPMGNVTIVDNLTTRLEYVAKSETSTLKANFSTQSNSQGSLVLRWELVEPIKPGEGGVIRFKCKVR